MSRKRQAGPAAVPSRRRSSVAREAPRGFRYQPDFLSVAEERELLAHIERLAFEPVRMHGVEARRQVAHFGVRYRYDAGALEAADALPAFLAAVATRVSHAARFPPQAPLETLVTRYPPGAGIGWHRDAPPFGPVVAGLSLAASCEMRLRLSTETGYEVYATELAPRSLYVFAGTARFRWQHRIPPVAALRYSITFRTIKNSPPPRVIPKSASSE